MLKCLEHLDAIYVACGPTDLRKNVDGLSILVKQSFGLDPFSRCLYLFCNGSRNRLKGLVWDQDVFIDSAEGSSLSIFGIGALRGV